MILTKFLWRLWSHTPHPLAPRIYEGGERGFPINTDRPHRVGAGGVGYFSRFFMLYILTANVDPLCRNADTGGGRMPSMPSTIRAELKPMMKL